MAEDKESLYKCQLDAATQQKAIDELGEDPETRLQAVRDMRQWMRTQPHLVMFEQMASTADILQFLRASKYSQDKARSRVSNLTALRDKHPKWFRSINSQSPRMQKLLECLYVMPLPGKDENGCKVVLYRMGSFDPGSKDYDKADIMQTFSALFMLMAEDENNQVNGYVYILDCSDFNTRQQMYWGIGDLKTLAKLWQGALPARFKAFHFLNMGVVFEVLFKLLMPFLSKKFRQRIIIHHKLQSLHGHFPMRLLPVEYLPSEYEGPNGGTMRDIVDNVKKEIQEPDLQRMILEKTGGPPEVKTSSSSRGWGFWGWFTGGQREEVEKVEQGQDASLAVESNGACNGTLGNETSDKNGVIMSNGMKA